MQAARKLLRRGARARADAYLVEGFVQVHEALRSKAGVRELFVADDLDAREELERAARERGVPVVRVLPRLAAALSETTTPQGTVAVVDAPRFGLLDIPREASLVVVLADVRDPGNAGALVRSAVAAGADAIIFASGSVDALHPKTVRASSAAIFQALLLRDVDLNECLRALRDRHLAVLGTDASGEPLDEVDLSRPVAVVLGNEAWGMAPGLRDLVDACVSVPMPGPVESLNVAIAGSIVLFEAVRQRRDKARGSS